MPIDTLHPPARETRPRRPRTAARFPVPTHNRWTLALFALFFCVAAVPTSAGGAGEPHSVFRQFRWEVIAHQGGNHLWPDNTMVAFEGAAALGVDVLEMDVHQTADGAIVVIHDHTVDRTTDGTGTVWEMTLAEINSLDAAYRWPHHLETQEYPYRGAGVTIPTLEEVLHRFPDMPMVIEIKQKDPPMVDDFGALLRRFDRAANTVVASFHPEVISEFRQKFPEFATAGVEPEVRRFYVLNSIFLGGIYRPTMDALQVPERFGRLRVIKPRFVRVARRKGLAVHVWTVNRREDMERILETGVDGIMTDRPDLLLDVLGRAD